MKRKHILLIIIGVVILLLSKPIIYYINDYLPPKDKLHGLDYRKFRDTPVWSLAKAARIGDIKEMEKILSTGTVDVNFREPTEGFSLLHLAVSRKKYYVVKTLLDFGADPNLYSDSTVVRSSGINAMCLDTSAEIFRLLLNRGGDPNSAEIYTNPWKNRRSALMNHIIYGNKEIVQQLVESGVDINSPIPKPPVIQASMRRHYDITLYLLQAGAEYRNAYFVNVHSDTIGLLGTLRLDCYYDDLNSERHRQKMKVVEYLMEKGMNYWEEPIPDYIQEKIKEMYPDTWKEFLKKY